MDIRGLQLLRAQLRVRRGGRVDDQALHVRHIGQQREDLQRVNDKRFSFKSEELTFDRFYSYFDSVVQAELSSSHPQKQNNRGARLGPRSSAKQ